MGKQQEPSGNVDMRKVMEFAGTSAGRQLLKLLQSQNNAELQNAVSRAAAGDYESAKRSLSALLEDPQIRELLKQLEG